MVISKAGVSILFLCLFLATGHLSAATMAAWKESPQMMGHSRAGLPSSNEEFLLL